MSTSAPIQGGPDPTAADLRPAGPAATPASAELGPQPARTDRPRDAAMRVLRCLAAAEDPVTITALTAELGGHPNSVRMHLENLVSEGFVIEEPAPTGARGRPPRAYRATVDGLQVAGQDDTWDGSSALVAALAEQFATGPDPVASAQELGRRWGRRLRDSDAGLLTTLAAQGFTPRIGDDGIELRTCPLLTTARQLPQVVCSIHQGLIDELSDDPLRLVPFARPGACVLRPVTDSA